MMLSIEDLIEIPIVVLLGYVIFALRKQNRLLRDINSLEAERANRWKSESCEWADEIRAYKERIVCYYKEASEDMEKALNKARSDVNRKEEVITRLESTIDEHRAQISALEGLVNDSKADTRVYLRKLESLYQEAVALADGDGRERASGKQ